MTRKVAINIEVSVNLELDRGDDTMSIADDISEGIQNLIELEHYPEWVSVEVIDIWEPDAPRSSENA